MVFLIIILSFSVFSIPCYAESADTLPLPFTDIPPLCGLPYNESISSYADYIDFVNNESIRSDFIKHDDIKKLGEFGYISINSVEMDQRYIYGLIDDIGYKISVDIHHTNPATNESEFLESENTFNKKDLTDMRVLSTEEYDQANMLYPTFVYKGIKYTYYPRTITDENGSEYQTGALECIAWNHNNVQYEIETEDLWNYPDIDGNTPTVINLLLDATTAEKALEYLHSKDATLEDYFPEYCTDAPNEDQTDVKVYVYIACGALAILCIGGVTFFCVRKKKMKQ